MSDGDFKKVGESDERMFGPRKMLVCGYPSDDQKAFIKMLNNEGMEDLAAVFPVLDQVKQTLGELMDLPDQTGLDQLSEMPRAIIMSGLSEKELHAVMQGHRKLGLPGPLWATLTETSVNWSLLALLKELLSEREALMKRQSQQ